MVAAILAVACARGADETAAVAQRTVQAVPGEPIETDPRTAIPVDAAARLAVLTEMRIMLKAVQGIVAGAANDDPEAMRRAAGMAGMQAATEANPAVVRQLGDDFARLGMRTHASFDSLAADLGKGKDRNLMLRRLSAVMGNCVGCHEQWRLAVTP
jgi:hypothetical protein